MENKRKDIYSGVVMLLFAAFFYGTSFLIQATTSDILGSRFFPQMAAILIALLAVIQIVLAVRKPAEAPKAETKTEDAPEKHKGPNMPLILTTLALFAYYLLTLAIGFTLTSILYLLFEGLVLMNQKDRKDKKKLIILAVVSVVIPVFLNTVFWNVFAIALPAGVVFEML